MFFVAIARVLKNLAHHNHLSNLIFKHLLFLSN